MKEKEKSLYIANTKESTDSFFSKSKVLSDFASDTDKRSYFLVKDNFWTEQFLTTASSQFLSSFLVREDATVIKILKDCGFKLLGKSYLDEFACGGTGLFSSQKILTNPYDSKRIVGGSSSGSAWAVAKGIVDFSLAHDTGDSVRRPSSYCGVVGFKPSYGLVSRYGVIPMASSLDTVGIIAQEIEVVEKVFSLIKKNDYKDLVTVSSRNKQVISARKEKEIIVIKNIEELLDEEYKKKYLTTLESLKKHAYIIKEIEFPNHLKEILYSTYLVICSTEIVSHLNSLQGITYGDDRNLTVKEKRTFKIGKWVKERVVLGNYFLSDQFTVKKARRLRATVSQWINHLFEESSFFLFPGTQGPAPLINDLQENLGIVRNSSWVDDLLLIANFSGNPSVNLPIGKVGGMPVSVNIDCSWGNDQKLIEISKLILKK